MKRWLRVGVILSSLMFMCSTVFADIPNGTVVIGNKGYDIKYANSKENEKVIRNAIRDLGKDGKIYIKSFNGVWYANNGDKVQKTIIPVVDYNSKSGEVITYESGDSGEFLEEGFKVTNVSFLDAEYIEITFSQELKDKKYSEKIKLSGNYGVKDARAEGRKLIVKLKDKLSSKIYEGTITISGDIQNVDDESLGKEIQEEIYVINKEELSNRTFDKNVCIISPGFKGENLTFNRGLNISGNSITLKNSKVDKLSLTPGKSGNVTLYGVTAEKMYVMAGGSQSITIRECDINEFQVNSSGITRVTDLGQSKVQSTIIQSEARLESKRGAFENIKILSSEQKNRVDLRGKFKKIIAENNSVLLSSDQSEVDEVIVKGDVEIEGIFSTIDVQKEDARIKINGGTKIKKFIVNEKNTVKVSGKVYISDMEGPHNTVYAINRAVKVARRKAGGSSSTKKITLNVQDIELNMTIENELFGYNGAKYKAAEMTIDLSNLELTDAEKLLGMSILIYDENNNVINAIQQKVINNKLENDKLFIREGKIGRIVLYTEQKGIIEFVFEP